MFVLNKVKLRFQVHVTLLSWLFMGLLSKFLFQFLGVRLAINYLVLFVENNWNNYMSASTRQSVPHIPSAPVRRGDLWVYNPLAGHLSPVSYGLRTRSRFFS